MAAVMSPGLAFNLRSGSSSPSLRLRDRQLLLSDQECPGCCCGETQVTGRCDNRSRGHRTHPSSHHRPSHHVLSAGQGKGSVKRGRLRRNLSAVRKTSDWRPRPRPGIGVTSRLRVAWSTPATGCESERSAWFSTSRKWIRDVRLKAASGLTAWSRDLGNRA